MSKYTFISPTRAERDRVAGLCQLKGGVNVLSERAVWIVADEFLRPVEQRDAEPDAAGYQKLNAAKWTAQKVTLYIVESTVKPGGG